MSQTSKRQLFKLALFGVLIFLGLLLYGEMRRLSGDASQGQSETAAETIAVSVTQPTKISPIRRDQLPFNPPVSDEIEAKRNAERLRAKARDMDFGSIHEILDAADGLESSDDKEGFIAEALLVYSRKSFGESAEFLLGNPLSTPEVLEQFVASWNRETFDAPESEPAYGLEGFRDYIRSNPAEAAAFLDKLPSSGIKTVASFETAEIWFVLDSSATIDWVTSLTGGSEEDDPKRFAMMALGEQWVQRDGVSAIDWVMKRSDRDDWIPFFEGAIGSLGREDHANVTEWFATIDDQSLRRTLSPLIAEIVAVKSLDDAKSIFEDSSDPETKQDILLAMTFASIEMRPEETMRWLGTLTSDEDVKVAISHATAAWADSSRIDVERWIKDHPTYIGRDAAIAGMLSAETPANFQSSMNWALEIGNAELRQVSIQHTLENWRQQRGLASADAEMVAFLKQISQSVSSNLVQEVRAAILALDELEE